MTSKIAMVLLITLSSCAQSPPPAVYAPTVPNYYRPRSPSMQRHDPQPTSPPAPRTTDEKLSQAQSELQAFRDRLDVKEKAREVR